MSEDMPPGLEPGGRLGDLEIEALVGRGAFATVWRARDLVLGRLVALKVLDPARLAGGAASKDDVLREARMVASLTGPHVATLFRIHELPGGRWCFEMEYVGGGDLRRRLDEGGALSPAEVVRIGRALLLALEEAHGRGIVHHDVKPANVLLTESGDVKLSDFGLGRLTQEDDLEESMARGPRGTPQFMAPEIVMGKLATPAADLWSLGVLLYQLVTGRVPFPGSSIERLFHEIQNEPPPPLPADVPAPLGEAIFACLLKRAEDRPVSATAVLEILARETARRPAPPLPTPGPPTRIPAVVGRGAEREHLDRLLDTCREGARQFVLLKGEAGVGKTALLRATAERAHRRGFRALEVRVGSLEGLRRPLLGALRSVATGERPSASGGPDAPFRFTSHVLQNIRLSDGPGGEPRSGDLDWVFERALRELARERPLLLVVEDAHLGQREDLRLLQTLATHLTALPLLLAVSFRTRDPASSDAWEQAEVDLRGMLSRADATEIDLAPLDREAVRDLLFDRFDLQDVPNEVLDRVLRKSEGVPLYALEFFRHLLDSGEIERRGEGVVSTERWGGTELPRNIRDMVQHRLAGLSGEDRELLEMAAVGGVEFDGRGLAIVLEQKLVPLLRALQRIYRDRAILRPTEEGFRFDHALFRDVIYEDLAPELRRALHEQWAHHLQKSEPVVDPEVLGWHWEQAGRLDEARGPLLAASQEAARRLESTRAWDLAERARVLGEDVDDVTLREHLPALLHLTPAYNSPEEADRVEALYRRLADAAARLGDREMSLRVEIETAYHTLYRQGAGAVDEAALRVAAETVDDAEARGDALRLLGTVARYDAARADEARALHEHADACYAEAGVPISRTAVLASLAAVCRVAGDFGEAERLYTKAADLHAEMVSAPRAAINRLMSLIARAQSGRLEGTAEAMTAHIEELEESGQAARAGHVRALQGELLSVQGRRAEARSLFDRARRALEDGALGDGLLALRLLETRFFIEAGALTAATRELRAVHEHLGEAKARTRPEAVLLEAYLHAAAGETASAREVLETRLPPDKANAQPLYAARLLQELARLALLGVDLAFFGDPRREADDGDAATPPFLAMARTLLAAAIRSEEDDDAVAIWKEARRATQEVVAPWFPQETCLLGTLLGARAARREGDRVAAADTYRAAAAQARALGLVWHELRALGAAELAADTACVARVREIEAALEAQNPDDADLLDRLRERGVIPAT